MTKSLSASRFGGQSICPGCSKPGTITETKLGPNNERWHFKCLRCVQCHKSLDSGAKTFDDSKAVGCRDCLVRFSPPPSRRLPNPSSVLPIILILITSSFPPFLIE
jgi:hypothetical protein